MFLSLARGLSLWGCALALVACSPTYNWRAWRVDGAPLLSLMPCKPETAERSVPLAGTAVALHMHSCRAGGITFAVAWADVGDAAHTPAALGAWRQASLQALRVSADAPVQAWPVVVVGAGEVVGVQAQGVDHDGQPVQHRGAYFAQGSRVFQAAVYGARLPDEALDPFFAGLRLSPP